MVRCAERAEGDEEEDGDAAAAAAAADAGGGGEEEEAFPALEGRGPDRFIGEEEGGEEGGNKGLWKKKKIPRLLDFEENVKNIWEGRKKCARSKKATAE